MKERLEQMDIDCPKLQLDNFQEMRFPKIRVQSVLYNLDPAHLTKSLEYLDNAACWAKRLGCVTAIEVAYGDCSPKPVVDRVGLAELRSHFRNIDAISYTFFDSNIGSAAGHNRLGHKSVADYLMVLNPDVLAAPNLLIEMFDALGKPGVGLVEARQLPIEHPKYFDKNTGETSWASTACILVPYKLFRLLDGFDSANFFLYGDDVDFSWRLRLLGHTVVHRNSAVIYHDKRVDPTGGWIPSPAEKYFSAEAGVLLPYKFSHPDLSQKILEFFQRSGDAALERAAANFELRKKADALPVPIDPDHAVAQFIGGNYAVHRYDAH